MKELKLMLILMLAAMMLLVGACGKDDDDNGSGITDIPEITPEDYDWDIYFAGYTFPGEEDGEYFIYADWLGDEDAIDETDHFSLEIDGEDLELYGESWFGIWSFYTQAELQAGRQYSVKLLKNENSVASTNLRMPHQPLVNFPEYYDPTESTAINWELSADSQIQVFSLYSYSEDYDEEDYWDKVLSPSDRSVTIPKNAVTSFGFGTEYDMTLVEMNFKTNKRVAFSAIAVDYDSYGEDHPLKERVEALRELVKSCRIQY